MQGMDYVYAVWQEKSFSAAARKLFVSQPALSASVRKVERELGLPIFNRSTTPLQLTDAGRAYIDAAERIFRIHAGDTDMPGLGDRASRNTTARSMAIQNGRLTVQLSAASARGARDQAIQDQDNQRLRALAERVAPRMQP